MVDSRISSRWSGSMITATGERQPIIENPRTCRVCHLSARSFFGMRQYPAAIFRHPRAIFLSKSRFAPISSVLMEEDLRYAFAKRRIHGDTNSSNSAQPRLKVIHSPPTNLFALKKPHPSLDSSGHQHTLCITFRTLYSRY